jgi:hypothetical protein
VVVTDIPTNLRFEPQKRPASFNLRLALWQNLMFPRSPESAQASIWHMETVSGAGQMLCLLQFNLSRGSLQLTPADGSEPSKKQ